LETEHDNIRAALAWALEGEGEGDELARLPAALFYFFYIRAHISEGRDWVRAWLARPDRVSPSVRAELLKAAGALAHAQGDHAEAARQYNACLELSRTEGLKVIEARTLANLAVLAHEREDLDLADRHYEAAAAAFEALGDSWATAALIGNRSSLAQDRGDPERAQELATVSLRLLREVGDTRGIAMSLVNLAEFDIQAGRSEPARIGACEALEESTKVGDKELIAYSIQTLGDSLTHSGEMERAVTLWAAADSIRRDVGIDTRNASSPSHLACLEATRRAIGARWDPCWEAGARLSVGDAIAMARSTCEQKTSD
ncbi:MAG TPA: hypothetical protein VGP30_01720, partial [Candidatus Limnocylindrales bacterium]|nr:hypothetical protein [Candidatus Limnocylindrales bacterium]